MKLRRTGRAFFPLKASCAPIPSNSYRAYNKNEKNTRRRGDGLCGQTNGSAPVCASKMQHTEIQGPALATVSHGQTLKFWPSCPLGGTPREGRCLILMFWKVSVLSVRCCTIALCKSLPCFSALFFHPSILICKRTVT